MNTSRNGALEWVRRWWRALRPESFPVSAVPALLGTNIAWQEGWRIEPLLALMTLFGAVAIHAATNLLQDYFDFKSGLDREGTLGGSGMLTGGFIRPRSVAIASAIFYLISAAVAGYLIYASGIELAIIVGAGLVLGSSYAIPKFGLKYNMLGDLGVFAAFGVGITMGSYFVQTGRVDAYPLFYAVPFGLLVVAMLHANNMRDAGDDLQVGLRNTAERLGERTSRALYAFLVIGAFALPALFVFARLIPRSAIAVLLVLPVGLKLVGKSLTTSSDEREVMAAQVIRTALLALLFGLILISSLVVGRLVG